MINARVSLTVLCGIALLLPVCVEADPPGDGAPPPDSGSVDPFLEYLESLGRETDRAFSDQIRARVPISDGEIDSLIAVYEETGEAPDGGDCPAPAPPAAELTVAPGDAVSANIPEGYASTCSFVISAPSRVVSRYSSTTR